MALSCNKKLSAILKGKRQMSVILNCLNCLHLFGTKNKLESHKQVCENKDLCGVITPSEDARILEFNQYLTFDLIRYCLLFRQILNR